MTDEVEAVDRVLELLAEIDAALAEVRGLAHEMKEAADE